MSAVTHTPMVIAAARELCRQHANACEVNKDDCWNLYAEDFKRDAQRVLDAACAPELLNAAKAVAFSNGFDAALPDKMEALRAAIRKATGATND